MQDAKPTFELLNEKPEELTQIRLFELLYFAYRDFTHDADRLLEHYGFGRAHHRVLHFVFRNQGIYVADLLNILKITKQSLAPILKQLIAEGFVEQRQGEQDRRQRALFVTEKGDDLTRKLCACHLNRFSGALGQLGEGGEQVAYDFLLALTDEQERPEIQKWISSEKQ